MTEYNIRLNPNCASVVHTGLKFKKGDKGITFKIAVDEMDTVGTTAKIVFLRANGTSVESDISGTDGVYTYKTLGNEFAVPGKTVADVKIYLSGNRESTASFLFDVCGDTMDGLGAGAGGYSDRLEQLVKETEEAGELTEQAKVELEAAESDMEDMKAEMETVLQNFKEQYSEVGALNPSGTWTTGIKYQIRDVVYHNSSSWISLVDNNTVEPTDANKTHWMRSTDLQSILNGTTPVGDSKKLNGLTATEVGASGARNLIPYPYRETTKTVSEVVFTDNGDGTISVSGANTSDSYIIFSIRTRMETASPLVLKTGTYTISGTPANGSNSTYFIQVGKTVNNNYGNICYDYGDGATFTLTEETQVQIEIVIRPNTEVDFTFKPMLELGSVAHDYVPYHFGGAEHALDADTVGGWHIYNSISELGITSYAITDIVQAMDNNSMFFARSNSNSSLWYSVNSLPSGTGLLRITKFGDVGRTEVVYLSKTSTKTVSMYLCDLDETNWVINGWKHVGDGGNADTVDGWHIYSSLSELGLDETTATAESIVNAMADKSMLLHKLGGTATSATLQFPYNYSTLKVTKLSVPYVTFECIGTGNLPIYYAYYNGGSTNKWSGWSTQFLPLTGGKVTRNATMETIQLERTDGAAPGLGFYIKGARVGILHGSADGRLFRRNGDLSVTAEMLDTSNSAKVVQATSAPSDTTAVWVDTANKVTKIYKDGAWTALA